ncbi:conserved hypothetical protein [Listeria monocytogenes str. 1/2a F6854]|nr:conserved hypothetical protein [Listeria monocytogenes str. 1/2a F6854] [Listeria monocytogenes serotype 1/2a str. F6854]
MITTYLAPSSMIFFAAAFISSKVVNLPRPDNWPASNKFGVVIVAFGNSKSRIASAFSGWINSSSPLQTITGSITTFFKSYLSMASRVALMISIEPSIPVFIASTGPPERIVFSCSRTSCASIGVTPCAQLLSGSIVTIVVIALKPYVPYSSNVFRSACKPAPPLESEPAIVNVFLIVIRVSSYK